MPTFTSEDPEFRTETRGNPRSLSEAPRSQPKSVQEFASMNRTSSLSLQIAFFIIMILGLTLFFGAYALAIPAVAGYIWLAVAFGRRRLYA